MKQLWGRRGHWGVNIMASCPEEGHTAPLTGVATGNRKKNWEKQSHRNGDPLDKETLGVYFEGMTKSATVVSSVILQVSMWLGCLAADMVKSTEVTLSTTRLPATWKSLTTTDLRNCFFILKEVRQTWFWPYWHIMVWNLMKPFNTMKRQMEGRGKTEFTLHVCLQSCNTKQIIQINSLLSHGTFSGFRPF